MNLRANLKWGLTRGLALGMAYSVLAIAVYVVGGPGPFAAQDLELHRLIGAYLVGGIAAGLVIGVLRPLARWPVGAFAVGILAAIPAVMGLAIAINGHPRRWDDAAWFATVGTTFFFGALFCRELVQPSDNAEDSAP